MPATHDSGWTPPDNRPLPPAANPYAGPPAYTSYVFKAPNPVLQNGQPPGHRGVLLAELGQRFVALLIDQFLFVAVGCVLYIPVGIVLAARFPGYAEAGGNADAPPEVGAIQIVVVLVLLVIQAVYQTVCVAMWGATLGKKVMKLRVVRAADCGPVDWEQATGRAGTSLLLTLVPFAGYLDLAWGLWDKPNRQALHDKAARTLVIRTEHAPYGMFAQFTG